MTELPPGEQFRRNRWEQITSEVSSRRSEQHLIDAEVSARYILTEGEYEEKLNEAHSLLPADLLQRYAIVSHQVEGKGIALEETRNGLHPAHAEEARLLVGEMHVLELELLERLERAKH